VATRITRVLITVFAAVVATAFSPVCGLLVLGEKWPSGVASDATSKYVLRRLSVPNPDCYTVYESGSVLARRFYICPVDSNAKYFEWQIIEHTGFPLQHGIRTQQASLGRWLDLEDRALAFMPTRWSDGLALRLYIQRDFLLLISQQT
jgi:hypothetical protein